MSLLATGIAIFVSKLNPWKFHLLAAKISVSAMNDKSISDTVRYLDVDYLCNILVLEGL